MKVTTRLHFEFRDYYRKLDPELGFQFVDPLHVILEGINHGPRLRTSGDSRFEEDMNDPFHCTALPFAFQRIKSTDAPDYAQKAIFNRRGVWIRSRTSVHERADEQLVELKRLGLIPRN